MPEDWRSIDCCDDDCSKKRLRYNVELVNISKSNKKKNAENFKIFLTHTISSLLRKEIEIIARAVLKSNCRHSKL